MTLTYAEAATSDLAPLNATIEWQPDGYYKPMIVNSDCASLWTGDYRYKNWQLALAHAERHLRSIIRRATR